jgi:hypothetical protein
MQENSKDWWDKTKIIASVCTPIVIIVSGVVINSALKKSEIRVKYVEVAVSILKDKPRDDTKALRNWAIDVLESNSITPLSRDAIEELRMYPLPPGIYLRDEAGNIITDESGKSITTQ